MKYGLVKTDIGGKQTRNRQRTVRRNFHYIPKAIILYIFAWLAYIHLAIESPPIHYPFDVYIPTVIPFYHNLILYITTCIILPLYTTPYTLCRNIAHLIYTYSSHLCKFYHRTTFHLMISYTYSVYTLPLTLTCSSVCINIVLVFSTFYNRVINIYLGVFYRETLTILFNLSGNHKTSPLCVYYRHTYRILSIDNILESCYGNIKNSKLYYISPRVFMYLFIYLFIAVKFFSYYLTYK